MSDITFDFSEHNKVVVHQNYLDPWKVTIVDTGLDTLTGGRIKRIQKYIGNETFMLTYGDGVSDVNLTELLKFHRQSNHYATLTAIQPGGRFGMLDIDDTDQIQQFREKKNEESGWINGGFMVLEPQVFDYIDGDQTTFEREPLEKLAIEKQLMSYKHIGFWQCMDTLRDKELLENIWKSGKAPWKTW